MWRERKRQSLKASLCLWGPPGLLCVWWDWSQREWRVLARIFLRQIQSEKITAEKLCQRNFNWSKEAFCLLWWMKEGPKPWARKTEWQYRVEKESKVALRYTHTPPAAFSHAYSHKWRVHRGSVCHWLASYDSMPSYWSQRELRVSNYFFFFFFCSV